MFVDCAMRNRKGAEMKWLSQKGLILLGFPSYFLYCILVKVIEIEPVYRVGRKLALMGFAAPERIQDAETNYISRFETVQLFICLCPVLWIFQM
jgi:hypothetical protein